MRRFLVIRRPHGLAPLPAPWPLDEVYAPVLGTPGCYWVEPQWEIFLWIAANELPLLDELVPFLLARSGQALDEFCRWVAPRRPLDWVLTLLDPNQALAASIAPGGGRSADRSSREWRLDAAARTA